jgi:hypothetical protein
MPPADPISPPLRPGDCLEALGSVDLRRVLFGGEALCVTSAIPPSNLVAHRRMAIAADVL